MNNKETGKRDGSQRVAVLPISFVGRDGTVPQCFRSSLILKATARAVEMALDKEID